MFRAIYYSSKTFNEAQENYSTTEKEMLVVVFACDKFRPYILGSQRIVHIHHVSIRYLMGKNKVNHMGPTTLGIWFGNQRQEE